MDHAVEPTNKALWQHYQNDAQATFYGAHARLAFLKKTAQRLHPNQKLRVLNIGIGEGWLEEQCKIAGWQVSALDPDETAAALLRKRGIDSKSGTITRAPFDSSAFDVIFCSEVLEHLRDDEVGAALAELSRCLRSSGHLLGTVPYREKLAENTVFCPHCQKSFHRWGHLQSFDEVRLRKLMTASLFDVLAMETRAFADFSRPGFRNKAKSLARAVLGRLGEPIASPNLFFVGRKRT